jgi:hypothetical protein
MLEGSVDFAGKVGFEASHGFFLGFAFGEPTGDVVACGLVAAHSDDQDGVQGTVVAAVETVANCFAAGGIQW